MYTLESCAPDGIERLFATHRRLPHYMPDDLTIMLTVVQRGALPQDVLERVRGDYEVALKKTKNAEKRVELYDAYSRAMERLLDRDCTGKLIGEVASMVADATRFMHDNGWLKLYAYIVMPNHVHLLARSACKHVDKAIEDFKHYTTTQYHQLRSDVTNSLWQRECFDRWIRNMRHFWAAMRYIHANPVKAGLCKDVLEWPYSSARWYV